MSAIEVGRSTYWTIEFSSDSFQNIFVSPRPSVDVKAYIFRIHLHNLDEPIYGGFLCVLSSEAWRRYGKRMPTLVGTSTVLMTDAVSR